MKYLFSIFLISYSIYVCAQEDVVFDKVITVHSNKSNTGGSIATDINGNFYYLGRFDGTADFDPGLGIYNMSVQSNGFPDPYIVKLDSNGDFVWAKKFDNKSSLTDIVVDSNENVYISGHWRGTVDFDPGPGVKNFVASTSERRAFFLKLDSNGDYVWFRFITASSYTTNYANGIAMDSDGNIYGIGGFEAPTASASTGSGYVNIVSSPPFGCGGGMSDFVIKYDSDGNVIWTKGIDICSAMGAGDIFISSVGNIFITGSFKYSTQIETTSGTINVDGGATIDAYVAKILPNGDVEWFKQFWVSDGIGSNGWGKGIVTDNDENVYCVGYFKDTIDMDPGIETNYFIASNYDIFLCKLSENGDFVWANQISGTGNDDISKSITIDDESNIYVAGNITGNVDFSGQAALTSSGERDVFFLKSDADGNYLWVKRIGGTGNDYNSDLLLDQNNDIIVSGTYIGDVDFNPNAPVFLLSSNPYSDAFYLKLKQCVSTTGTFTHTACGSYNWYGTTYTSNNNTATHILTNAFGCDSVVTLDLTIIPISESMFTHTACEPYQWINGTTYTSSNNTATYIVQDGGANGCDSIIRLDLTIININNTVSVSVNNDVLTANQTEADDYQWIDCNNGNTPISGATSRSYSVTENGSYAVLITQDGCTKLSDCYEITNLGVVASDYSLITIHPNPVSNSISVNNIPFGSIITITDLTGKILTFETIFAEQVIIDTENLSGGVYFLGISNKDDMVTKKFIVQR